MNILLLSLGCTDRPQLVTEWAGHRIIGADAEPGVYRPAELAAFEPVPRANDEGFVPRIAHLIEQYQIDLVVSGLEMECNQLQRLQPRYSRVAFPVVSRFTETLSDKGLTYDALAQTDLAPHVPRYACLPAREAHYLLDQARGLLRDAPAIVAKPADGFGGAGCWRVQHRFDDWAQLIQRPTRDLPWDTFARWVQQLACHRPEQRLMVSEALGPPSYSVDVFSQQGTVRLCVPHRRESAAWGPIDHAVIESVPIIDDLAQRLTDTFGLSGAWNFEVNADADRWGLLEINPRLSDTAYASSRATDGAYAQALIQQARRESVLVREPALHRYTVRPMTLEG